MGYQNAFKENQMKDKKITIAIQKSGRLSDNSKNLLEKSGINFRTSGEKLLARSSNMNIDILLVRDDDIPSLVSKGVADLGIVGENVLAEQTATNARLKARYYLIFRFFKVLFGIRQAFLLKYEKFKQ
jgi:ATP phosphoribosyltransferase